MKKMIFAAVGIAFLIGACKKEVDNNDNSLNNTIPQPSHQQIISFFDENVKQAMQTFSFKAEDGVFFVGSKGSKVIIYPNSLKNPDGSITSGTVTLEFLEIFDRGDMILMNKPTMAKGTQGFLTPLISGGEFYLRASQNGNTLQLNTPAVVRLPTDNQETMNTFTGEIVEDNLVWNLADSSAVSITQDTTTVNNTWYYDMWVSNFGWVNCDYFYYDPSPKTNFEVQLPQGFNGSNAYVFLTFNDGSSLVAQLGDFDQDGKFIINNLPIGLSCHVICVAKDQNTLYHAIQAASVTAGQTLNISAMTAISETDLSTLINNLP